MNPKTALLIGATGLVGGHCLRQLLADDYYGKVVVLARRKPGLEHPKLEAHVVDFDRIAENPGLVRADDLYCCMGTTRAQAKTDKVYYQVDFTYPFEVAALARKNGAVHCAVVTAIGASRRSPFFYVRTKGELEKALGGLGFRGLYIFRPSLLVGERDKDRRLEALQLKAADRMGFLFRGPVKKYRPIKAQAVARAMILATRQDSPGVNIIESDRIQEIADGRR